jgi:acyl carrier protein
LCGYKNQKGQSPVNVRAEIVEQFERVAQEHNRSMSSLSDDLPLVGCGLDSLCFAVIVTRLEDKLGIDPFAAEDILFPVTFGEFIRLYETSGR